ncbi:MAG: PQQ-binding-like beta-propeller repeat protein [Rubripirellula sp.]|nr:PQQ-binding-like beta-propeller repeat protein [Rubripirellula sp.]
MIRLAFLLFVVCTAFSPLSAADWGQGSGPNGSYVADGIAAKEWSVVHSKNIAWVKPLPETGQSTVVIKDGKLFYTCYEPLKSDSDLGSDIIAHCADAETGEVLWQRTIAGRHPLRLSGCFSDSTSPPAVTDGELVCFFNASGTITCFDMKGNEVWSREAMAVGRSQPFLVDGSVVYTKQTIMPKDGEFGHEHKNARREQWTQLEALDLATGKTVWTSDCGVNMGAIPMVSRLTDGRDAIALGRGGGHSPPERPLGVSVIDGRSGNTIWTLPLDRYMSTQTYPIVNDLSLIFHGPEHLWVNLSGEIVRRVSICSDVPVQRWDGKEYSLGRESLEYQPKKGRAITQQSNLLVGKYHYFRAYTKPYLGRVNIDTGKVEYLQLPVQLIREESKNDRLIWSLKDMGFVPSEMKNQNGFVVMGDKRSRTNTWGHHASPIMTVVGQHLYLPTLVGTVYCIDWNADRLDEHAILGINDLGPAGGTWTRASLSYADGKLYAHTIKELICIEAD